jgi:hypothetical protein
VKLTVVTNHAGKVIATFRHGASSDPHAPHVGMLVAGKGQTVHEVTLPPHLHGIKSAEELHAAVAKLLPPKPPKRD